MSKENELPKYYNSDFDFSLLSKTELRKILFDHNITPPPYNTLKAELLEFYEINFHKKLKIFRKKYKETLKAIHSGNVTALDLSFDEDIVFPIQDVHEEINNSLNNLTPQKLIKNKKKLVSKANDLNSEDIEELEDLLIKQENNHKNNQEINEELITTPEALKSFSNTSFNFEDSFNSCKFNSFKKEIDPSVGSRTPIFCTPPFNPLKNINPSKNINPLKTHNSLEKRKKFFIYTFLKTIFVIIFLIIFLNEILKNLWCPFCLKTKPIFSEDFLKKFLNKNTFKEKGLKNLLKEFSFCQEKPEYIFFDEETQKFYFKPGFSKNTNFLTMPFRKFKIKDKMTFEAMKAIKNCFFTSKFFSLKFTKNLSSREVFDFLNASFENFFETNFEFYESHEFYNSEFKKSEFKKQTKNFMKTTFFKISLDLLIDNPRVRFFEDVFYFRFSIWNFVEIHFFKIFCFWIFFRFFVKIFKKFKQKKKEQEFVEKIVNEIISQEGINFEDEELRECYSELDDALFEKILKGIRVKK